jgi:hypothetical protein
MKLKAILIDYDRSFDEETADKNDDSSIETDHGLIAISPAAVFPMGGDTYVESYDRLCNMETPPPVLSPTSMGVLAFQGEYLPIEHVSVYTDGKDHQTRARLTAIAQTRVSRQEVGQRQMELSGQQRQFSDAFLVLMKGLGVVFALAVVAIVFVISQRG